MKAKELMIFTRKASFMQACVDAARYHVDYMTGLVDVEKVAELHEKMSRKYNLDLSKQDAYRLRAKGQATCRMLIYKVPFEYAMGVNDLGLKGPNTKCQWVIFASKGEHPLGDLGDTWRDFRTDRLEIVGGVEMFMHTRPAEPGKKAQSPSWSWRFSAKYYSNMRNEVITCIKTHTDWRLIEIISDAGKTPGFAGVREQLKKLNALVIATWGSTRRDTERPALPARFGYVRRITGKQVSLEWVIKQTRTRLRDHNKAMDVIRSESEIFD